jgi:hypothetical protein
MGKQIKYIDCIMDYINTVGDVIVSEEPCRITGPIDVGESGDYEMDLTETDDPNLKTVKFKYVRIIYMDDEEEYLDLSELPAQ